MSQDEETRLFYQSNAEEYARKSRVSPNLSAFLAELPAGASVLDLGCGGGWDSATLRDAGFAVLSWDASPELALQVKRLHGIEVTVAEFTNLTHRHAFDAVWASASLHHARAEDLPDVFGRIRTALKPGGLLHATFKANERDRRDAHGRFFCAMDETRLAELTRGWATVTIERGSGTGYGGEPTDWLLLRARD